MDKTEKIDKTTSYYRDSVIDFDHYRSSQAFCTYVDFTCLLWTLLVKKWQH